jgi:hypothetical protein
MQNLNTKNKFNLKQSMTKLFMMLLSVIIVTGMATTLKAQTSSTINTQAGVVFIVPMALTQTSPLHFGTINLVTIASGTCILSTVGARTFTGGLNGSSSVPLATNAAYSVTGRFNATYAVTLPTAAVTLKKGDSSAALDLVSVTAFTSRFSGASADALASKLSANGTDSFVVGATLTTMASQNAGVYAGTFNISIDYN